MGEVADQVPPTTTGVKRFLVQLMHRLVPTYLKPRSWAEYLLLKQSAGRVLDGPFKGMRFFELRRGWFWPARVMGTYELEIRPAIEHLVSGDYSRFVDVGAGDGYYAVGFALRRPEARVIAFEAEKQMHREIEDLGRMNWVEDRIQIQGFCGPTELAAALGNEEARTALLIDCEGFEVELLDPRQVPALAKTTVLVETHELLRAGVEKTLRQRFEESHDITVYHSRPRTRTDLPVKSWLLSRYLVNSATEYRSGPQSWWLMVPRMAAR
jgi:hypothetical protein